MLMLLVPLAMGLLVSARGMRRPEVITAVVLRSVFGLLVGLVLVWLFGFTAPRGHRADWRGGTDRLHRRGACRRAKDWISILPPAPLPFRFSWDRCGFRWP